MNYLTLTFLAVFVAFYAGYLLLQRTSRVLMMGYVVAFSLLFAYQANGLYMLLLPAVTVVSWILTQRMRLCRGKQRKHWLWVIVAADLLPLLFFKITPGIVCSFNSIVRANFQFLDLLVPVGLSFYTFQAISYSVDVYRRRFSRRVSLLEYAFYLTFFPLLLAGPITRAETLIPAIQNRHRLITAHTVYGGLWLIMLGLLKKGLLADYMGTYTSWIFDDPMAYSGFEDMVGLLAFSLQIYLDFSGYSDISIGLAALMGFKLKDNFNFPYRSTNPTDFWRRWHMSLSTWFRDYVYIPLGGNRVSIKRMRLNLMLTMLAAGLWHGVSWMFLLWGTLHGVALVVHKSCLSWLKRLSTPKVTNTVSWLLFYFFLLFTWLIFRAPDHEQAIYFIQRVAGDFSYSAAIPFFEARPLLSIIIVVGYLLLFVGPSTYRLLQRMFIMSPWLLKLILMILIVQLLLNIHADNIQPFIYEQF